LIEPAFRFRSIASIATTHVGTLSQDPERYVRFIGAHCEGRVSEELLGGTVGSKTVSFAACSVPENRRVVDGKHGRQRSAPFDRRADVRL
jgi:hypothetical protein